ncbi:MAG: hypothetical protein J0H98_09195 [Solirubrobacterales bacterium]|nr:hypothetical protein [Solirubrobacterales bacterium]
MKSGIKARVAGMLSVGVVTLAMGAAGVVAAPLSAATATTSGLTPAQKRAKAKAMKKCKKIKKASKRRACIKRVNKRFKPKPAPAKLAATVGVHDDYFSPTDVTIKKGQAVKWVWDNNNANAHNVTLVTGPAGLTPKDYYNLSTPNSPAVQYTFGPKALTKVGTYDFVCSLHSTVMNLKIKVTN